jgi:hypothetical protein
MTVARAGIPRLLTRTAIGAQRARSKKKGSGQNIVSTTESADFNSRTLAITAPQRIDSRSVARPMPRTM